MEAALTIPDESSAEPILPCVCFDAEASLFFFGVDVLDLDAFDDFCADLFKHKFL